VGNLRDYEDDRVGFLLTARDNYGDVVAFDDRTAIVSSGPLAQQILLNRERAFDIHENYLQRSWSPEGLEEAVALRRHLNPGLRQSAASGMVTPLARRIDDELAVWRAEGGGPRPPMAMLERTLTGSVGEYYFGADGEALSPLLTELLDALSRTILDPFVLPWHSLSPARRRIGRRHRRAVRLVTALLEARLDRPGRQDFASTIVRQGMADAGPERLADVVIGSMLAGQRVPAAAASWLLMLVAESPRLGGELGVEAELLDQSLAQGAGGDLSLREFPLATACVLEALRLYPTTWLITRRANRPVEVGGYSFGAGHHFMLSPYVIHRDEREFPDAWAFHPDRWLGGVPTGTFLPFGHGQHLCPGRHLATLALVVVLLRTLASGRIVRTPGTVRPDPRNTLVPDGLRLALREQAVARPSPLRAASPAYR
jgi:unspecific monooxygenase